MHTACVIVLGPAEVTDVQHVLMIAVQHQVWLIWHITSMLFIDISAFIISDLNQLGFSE